MRVFDAARRAVGLAARGVVVAAARRAVGLAARGVVMAATRGVVVAAARSVVAAAGSVAAAAPAVVMAVRPMIVLAVPLAIPPAAWAQANQDAATLERSASEYQKGNFREALVLVEGVLNHSPDDLNALYESAIINFHLNNADLARGRLERLVKLSGSYFDAWEMMVQVTQAQGDLARRDEAIQQLKLSIRTAIDPQVRRKADFIRDRIVVGEKEIVAVEFFGRAGSDFTRYQFARGDPRGYPEAGLLVRTDAITTENWSTTALLPQEKQLFHLDMVDRLPGGQEHVVTYEYYVGEPTYDTVRAKVLQILRGEARPLSGEPGSLHGILKR